MEEKHTNSELSEEARKLLEAMQISESELTGEAKKVMNELAKEENGDKEATPTMMPVNANVMLHRSKSLMKQKLLEERDQARKECEKKEKATQITSAILAGLGGAALAGAVIGINLTNNEVLTILKYILGTGAAFLGFKSIGEVAKMLIQKSRETRDFYNEPKGPSGR